MEKDGYMSDELYSEAIDVEDIWALGKECHCSAWPGLHYHTNEEAFD